ncbi:MAG: PTS glucose transporter subunit IIA [Bifidobacteriaceae bacterium]|jgi:PTS system N-acetylglucosamine-specific IIA component|nr:PTS glucose transporter subunit IIA [Bifidobacteriaceae bacterium]
MNVTVAAPVAGTVTALTEVPDPVFSQLMMGPGVAIDPDSEAVDVLSPVDGVIVSLYPHAFIVESVGGQAILVHLGLDTIALRGRGFALKTAIGDVVEAGQVLMTWDPVTVKEAGFCAMVPVVALQAALPGLAELTNYGDAIKAGDPLLALN